MKDLIQNWRGYIYGMWLGGSLGAVFDTGLLDFRFWVVLIPTAVFVKLFNQCPE